MADGDHDIVVETSTNVKWIRDKLENLCERESATAQRVAGLEKWQSEMIGLEIPVRMKDYDQRITAGATRDWMTAGVVGLLIIILGMVSAGRWIDLFW